MSRHLVRTVSASLFFAAVVLAACSPSTDEPSVDAPGAPAETADSSANVLDTSSCTDCDEGLGGIVFNWAAGEPGPRKTNFVMVEPLEGHVELTGLGGEGESGGHTSGAFFPLSGDAEALASGKTIRIEIEARGEAGQVVPVAYSTADVGNSGWKEFTLTGQREWLKYHYAVPAMNEGNNDYLGILPGADETLLLYRVRILIPNETPAE